jgi:hypothetical protein
MKKITVRFAETSIDKEIKDSGLADVLEMKHLTADKTLAPFLGHWVRYKKELLTPEFLRRNGTVTKEKFYIAEVQKDHKGKACLRGYFKGDTFGRVINPEDVETIN